MEPMSANLQSAKGNKIRFEMERAHTVTVYVPHVLRAYCSGRKQLNLPAASVQAALEELERQYPALYGNICDETGAVRRHVNLFINDSHIRARDGVHSVLEPGDVLSILPAVSGG
jgi:molybdopterin converting factor small subunit